MSENFNNSNGDMIHVDAYTRDDGTHVNEYWRRKRGNGGFANYDFMGGSLPDIALDNGTPPFGGFSNGGFWDEKYSNGMPNGGFAPPNPMREIEAPYNYQLGGIVPPYLQNNGGIVERNPIGMNEGRYNPLLSYLPTDNLGQNTNTNKMIPGVNYTPADLEHYLHRCTTDSMNIGDKMQEEFYLKTLGNMHKDGEKSPTAFLNNAVNDFEDAKNDTNATVYDSGNSIPDSGLRKFITTNDSITDHGEINVKNMRGAHYNANSDVSKSISHDPAIAKYVQEKRGELIYNGKKVAEYQEKLKNKKLPDGVKEKFKSEFIAKGNVDLRSFANIGDIAHCTLYNPHIDKNEHFKAQMIDIVDYNNRKYYGGYGYGYIPNQWGYKMQQMGMIENVFHVVDIDIPVREIYKRK